MRVLVGIALLAACGGSDDASPEVVVANASLGAGADLAVISATDSSVFWTDAALIGGAAIDALPATGQMVGVATGDIAAAGDRVVFDDATGVATVDLTGDVKHVTKTPAEMVAGSAGLVVWATAGLVAWGTDAAQMTATLSKVDRCDHAWVTGHQIYVAADSASGRRLLRIDQGTAAVTPATGTAIWAPMFPGGGADGATYTGRIVDASDDEVLWLVEEQPSGRGLLVADPAQGDAAVVLEHINGASGFFASGASLYWQEGSELLTAPREGGPASIVATLPGSAGAIAGGYVYFVHGSAIERLRVE